MRLTEWNKKDWIFFSKNVQWNSHTNVLLKGLLCSPKMDILAALTCFKNTAKMTNPKYILKKCFNFYPVTAMRLLACSPKAKSLQSYCEWTRIVSTKMNNLLACSTKYNTAPWDSRWIIHLEIFVSEVSGFLVSVACLQMLLLHCMLHAFTKVI